METIKVSVDVKVDFSESTKQFISQLVSSINNATPTSSAALQAPANPATPSTPKSVSSVSPASAAAPTTVSERGVTPEVVPAAPAPTTPEVTIEQVRQALAAKVNGHREEIKSQLSKFGAPSVTRLDPSHYMDMLIFLNSLA